MFTNQPHPLIVMEVLSQVVEISPAFERYSPAGFGFSSKVLGGGDVLCVQRTVSEFWTKNRTCQWKLCSGTNVLGEPLRLSHLVYFFSCAGKTFRRGFSQVKKFLRIKRECEAPPSFSGSP